ncbi:MAG: hypothetical protein QXO47_08790 [Thermoproteota archaeon]
MVNPELRKRFVNSMRFLREMGFFQDYSNLSSEEILDKILNGEIDLKSQWFVEEWSEEMRSKLRSGTFGSDLEEHEEYWMKASDSEIDLWLAFFDMKRVFVEDPEAVIREGICKSLMKKLARISRGVFNPTYVREEMSKWRQKPPPAWMKPHFDWGFIFKVYFKFRDREHSVEFYSASDFIDMNPAVKRINELIKDTGYQYYCLHDTDQIIYVVLSKDEVEELTKRGWKLSLP